MACPYIVLVSCPRGNRWVLQFPKTPLPCYCIHLHGSATTIGHGVNASRGPKRWLKPQAANCAFTRKSQGTPQQNQKLEPREDGLPRAGPYHSHWPHGLGQNTPPMPDAAAALFGYTGSRLRTIGGSGGRRGGWFDWKDEEGLAMENPAWLHWEATDRLRRRRREAEQARLVRRAEGSHRMPGLWARMGVLLSALLASLRRL
jgi:hypothetical protein